MNIEILYPEFLAYGEAETAIYLERLFPEAVVFRTSYLDPPAFIEQKIDLLFVGPMAEHHLQQCVESLRPHRTRLREMIDQGCTLLILNNAIDIFGASLEVKNGPSADTLDLFPYHTIRDYEKRRSELTLFASGNIPFVGTILGFSEYTGNAGRSLFRAVQPAQSFNPSSPAGGFREKNAFLLEPAGCIFLMNPPLARALRHHFFPDDHIYMEREMSYTYQKNLELMKKNPAMKSAFEAFPPSTWDPKACAPLFDPTSA